MAAQDASPAIEKQSVGPDSPRPELLDSDTKKHRRRFFSRRHSKAPPSEPDTDLNEKGSEKDEKQALEVAAKPPVKEVQPVSITHLFRYATQAIGRMSPAY